MKNIPILGKFLLIMAIFAGFAIGVAVYATTGISHISAAYARLEQRLSASALLLASANRNLQAVRASIADLLIANTEESDAAALKMLNSERTGFDTIMDKAITISDDADELRTLKRRGDAVIDNDCARSIELGKVATTPTAVIESQEVYEKECASKIMAFSEELHQKVIVLNDQVKQHVDQVGVAAETAVYRTFEFIVSGLVLVMIAGFLGVRSWIVSPLKRLAGTMVSLTNGDLTVAVTGTDQRDEIGTMSRSVQHFKDGAIEKQRVEAEVARERETFERNREADARRAAAEATKQQEHIVQSLAAGLGHLSSGNLGFRIEDRFTAEYETLRVDFNQAMASLHDAIRLVSTKSDAISTGTEEISQASQDLAQRTQRQASSLEETTTALTEVTEAVSETAKGASVARHVVSDAKQRVEQLGTIVTEAIRAMEEIEGSSSKIGQIIGVIDEIAFQTNLLALNAGVEAARAGEAGRGFAVVASEVRGLAQRSAEAAKEIKVLIHTSAEQTSRGVKLVGETGQTLTDIVAQVTQAHDSIVGIASSVETQASGLRQVSATVSEMDQVTQQNAAMVEESTAATQSLAQETGELVKLAGQFRLEAGFSSRRTGRAA